ncbi:hypothetical protein JCM11641_005357 [Rhodosporidiobolus odoratus]
MLTRSFLLSVCDRFDRFFNLLIVLFQPKKSAMYIAAQLSVGNMFLVAVMARNMMGTFSKGTNGLQRWQAEFAFLMAQASAPVIIASVFSDVHHIHGFGTSTAFQGFIEAERLLEQERLSVSRNQSTTNGGSSSNSRPRLKRVYGSHDRHLKEYDEYSRKQFGENYNKFFFRVAKWAGRHQAVILLCLFFFTELYWFILYCTTVWFSSADTITTFWQPSCDEYVGEISYRLIEGVSFTFCSLALLSTIFLAIPVFSHKFGASQSAAHFIIRLFTVYSRQPRKALKKAHATFIAQKDVHSPVPEPLQETKPEKILKIGFAGTIWLFWFISLMVTLTTGLRDFLLVGLPWPYAAIQNLLFGMFPMVKFFIDLKDARDELKKAANPERRQGSNGSVSSHEQDEEAQVQNQGMRTRAYKSGRETDKEGGRV